ncbi:hypothetical protein MA9V2_187 [Chryseobacterium phage MA9V-2]|nr:hypothetical protein MA9V2_187 [Chryseobacterium phage MA9V-2]
MKIPTSALINRHFSDLVNAEDDQVVNLYARQLQALHYVERLLKENNDFHWHERKLWKHKQAKNKFLKNFKNKLNRGLSLIQYCASNGTGYVAIGNYMENHLYSQTSIAGYISPKYNTPEDYVNFLLANTEIYDTTC